MSIFDRWDNTRPFKVLQGLTLASVEGCEPGSERVVFVTTCGRTFEMDHEQDCCQAVSIESVVGDVADLIGEPLLIAEGVSNENDPGPCNEYTESYTWTFYKLATRKGYVDIRWYGESNGYYSESVDFWQSAGEPLLPAAAGGKVGEAPQV